MHALSELMKVIGLTDELRGNAEQQCAAGLRSWIVEVQNGTWDNWDALKMYFPAVYQTSENEAHFPLTPNGTGIHALIIFDKHTLILDRIAPAPTITKPLPHHRTSLPPKPLKIQAIATHLS